MRELMSKPFFEFALDSCVESYTDVMLVCCEECGRFDEVTPVGSAEENNRNEEKKVMSYSGIIK